jgi:hypothetical protein
MSRQAFSLGKDYNRMRSYQSEWLCMYQAIENSIVNPGNKLIQLIACNSGEGTSTVARGLAKSCADILGKSVVILGDWLDDVESEPVVVADLVKTHPLSGISSVPGENYYYLATPALKNQDLAVLGWREIVRSEVITKSKFDLSLVESPALSVSNTGLSIARHADAVILVVEAENTRWPEILAAKENITKVGGNLLGMVLNKRRHYLPSWLSRFV